MSFEYIRRSQDVVQAIAPESLAELQLSATEVRGAESTFHGLGVFDVSGEEIYLGVKVPRVASGTLFEDYRLDKEAPAISLITDRAPELIPAVPRFVGRVVANGRAIATITEDASQNGQYSVQNRRISTEMAGVLTQAFCDDDEELKDYFYPGELNGTIDFDVNGHERLLDFTPNPFRMDRYDEVGYTRHLQAVEDDDVLSGLSVVIPGDSPFARSLQDLQTPARNLRLP